MIIADTSIWIDYLRGKASAGYLKTLLEIRNVTGLSCIFGELLQGANGEHEINILHDYWKYITKIDESGLMIRAGTYSNKKKLLSKGVGLIDALIIVAAEDNGMQIWTLDKKLRNAVPERILFNVNL